jgi:hypothetical protein
MAEAESHIPTVPKYRLTILPFGGIKQSSPIPQIAFPSVNIATLIFHFLDVKKTNRLVTPSSYL